MAQNVIEELRTRDGGLRARDGAARHAAYFLHEEILSRLMSYMVPQVTQPLTNVKIKLWWDERRINGGL